MNWLGLDQKTRRAYHLGKPFFKQTDFYEKLSWNSDPSSIYEIHFQICPLIWGYCTISEIGLTPSPRLWNLFIKCHYFWRMAYGIFTVYYTHTVQPDRPKVRSICLVQCRRDQVILCSDPACFQCFQWSCFQWSDWVWDISTSRIIYFA